MKAQAPYIVALTGASGAVYGLRLVDELLGRGDDVDLVISSAGFLILAEECGADLSGSRDVSAGVLDLIAGLRKNRKRGRGGRRGPGRAVAAGEKGAGGKKEGTLTFTPNDELASPASSGSSLRRAMIVCPSSMGTLARISAGSSGSLVERAADCILKERGLLVMVPRETPLSVIHLENMLRLARAGAVILPAMPGFYSKPESVDEMVDFVVGKVLDVLGVENTLYRRWDA